MGLVKRHFDAEDFEAALPLISEAYEQKKSQLVVRSYIFTLVNLSQWEQVLKACKDCDCKDLSFEQAYSLYRLNRFKEALEVLDSEPEETGRRSRLEAQARAFPFLTILIYFHGISASDQVQTRELRRLSGPFQFEKLGMYEVRKSTGRFTGTSRRSFACFSMPFRWFFDGFSIVFQWFSWVFMGFHGFFHCF